MRVLAQVKRVAPAYEIAGEPGRIGRRPKARHSKHLHHAFFHTSSLFKSAKMINVTGSAAQQRGQMDEKTQKCRNRSDKTRSN